MITRQAQLIRFLLRLAADIAYRREVLPHELAVVRALREHIRQAVPDATTAIVQLYFAAEEAESELQQLSQNPFAVLDVALKIAFAAGSLEQLSQCSTTQQVSQC
jgi:hypothetical protein